MLETVDSFYQKSLYFKTRYDLYKEKLDYYYNCAKNEIIRKEYGRGGATIHRGFYCPSPVLDKIVGNCKRGKLIKLPRKKPDYEYWYDQKERLILVKKTNPENENITPEIEILFYNSNSVDSIIYQKSISDSQTLYDVLMLTKCLFEHDKIISYDHTNINDFSDNVCYEIETENYEYKDSRLISSTLENYRPDENYLSQSQFFYNYDSNGKMSSYTTKHWYNGVLETGVSNNNIYYL